MFSHLDTHEDLFAYRLGAALAMEDDSLRMLAELERTAQSPDVKELFHHHTGQTREQIENLHEVCRILDISPTGDESSPGTDGVAEEGRALLRHAHDQLRDDIAISAALACEHHEIATYQTLVATAVAMHSAQVVYLLSENLEQEQHTGEELTAKAKELALAAAD